MPFMREYGVVAETAGQFVKIRLPRKPECGKCGMCGAAGNSVRILTLKTHIPLKVNQKVCLRISQRSLTLSYMLVYGLPLAGFIAGALIGYIMGGEAPALFCALALLSAGFLGVKIITKKTGLTGKIAVIEEAE